MSGILNVFDVSRFLSSSGNVEGATVYFYATGTSNLAPIYTDATLTTQLANPLTVAIGAIVPAIFLDPTVVYRRRIVFSSDSSVHDEDPLPVVNTQLQANLSSSTGAGLVGTTQGITVQANLNLKAPLSSPTFTGTPTAPTPSVFDNDTSIATTAFVQESLGNLSASSVFTTGTTLTAAQAGNSIELNSSSAITATLPANSTCPSGSTFFLINQGTGIVTLTRAGTDTIFDGISGTQTSIALYQGDSLVLTSKNAGGQWDIIGGTYLLRKTPNMVPAGGFSGLKIVTTGISNFTSTITANSIGLINSLGAVYVARSVSLSPVITGSGANGLDTGALAASTWYYLHVIYNPTTNVVAGLFSLSSTAPTLPSGYTFSARVGAVRTDASGSKYLLQTLQYGRGVQYVVTSGSNTAAMPIMASGILGNVSTPSWSAVAVASYVSPTAAEIKVSLGSTNDTGPTSTGVMAAPNNSYGAQGSTTNPPPMSITIYNSNTINQVGRFSLEGANIYYASKDSTGTLACLGWEDNL